MEYFSPSLDGAEACVVEGYKVVVDYIRSQQKIPVIAGVTKIDPDGFLSFCNSTIDRIWAAFKQVALENNVHCADVDLNYLAYSDGVHVNQASSNGLAENLCYVIAHIGYKSIWI